VLYPPAATEQLPAGVWQVVDVCASFWPAVFLVGASAGHCTEAKSKIVTATLVGMSLF
jgi:hypothetical protein